MYQLDEKLMADNRAIISIAPDKARIEPNLKPGMQAFETDMKDTYVVASEKKYHRLIQEDAYTNKIHYDLTFAGNITVEKNLVVKGNLTNLETEDLVVKDNIIELNKDETGNGISKGSAGIEINRGQKERARILYTETTDRQNITGFLFNLGDKKLFYIYEDGSLKTDGDLKVTNANIANDASIGRNLTVTGSSTLKGTLGVTGAATLNSTLNVKGISTLEGATSLKSTLNVVGATTLQNTLTVQEAVTFNKTLHTVGDTTLDANMLLKGNAQINGTLTADKTTTLKADLNVTGATTLNNTLTVKNNALLEMNLNVKGNTTIDGTASVTGKLSTTSISNTGNITTNTLSTVASASIGTTLSVTGATTLTGAANLKSSLTVAGTTTLNNTLSVTGASTLNSLTVNDSATITKNLTVGQATTLEGILTANSNAIFGRDVQIKEDLLIDKTLSVTGNSSVSNITASGDLTVQGTTTLNKLSVSGNINFTGPADIVNLKAETLTMYSTRNAIKWLNNTETYMLYGAATSESGRGYTLYDSTVNDYNVIFKADQVSGKEKGFVYVSGTTPIFHINQTGVRSTNNIYVKRNASWSQLLANSDSHKANHSIGGHDFLSPSDIGAVKNTKGTPELLTDAESAKPAAAVAGRLFFAKDTKRIWQDLGNTWQIIGGQDTMPWESITNKPATFTPPIATETVLGGVKIGNNIIVDPDGTIHVPKQTIEYTVHVEEFTATANQTTFTLSKSFLQGRNHVSPFIYGRRIPPSAYTETSDRTIVFKQGLPAGALIEFYVLLIPVDLSFVMKIEEFNVASGQTNFVLSQGRYSVGSNKLKVFLNGALMPRSAFTEVNSSLIQLKQSPGAGNHILIEYMYDPLA